MIFEHGDEIRQQVNLSTYSGIPEGSYGPCPVPGCKGDHRSKKVRVNVDRWKCFRCEASGDVIDWRAYRQNSTVGKAYWQFVQELGLSELSCPERSSILEAFCQAAHEHLLASPDKASYLTKTRAIPKEVIIKLGLGYVDLDTKVLQASGVSIDDLKLVGLLRINGDTSVGLGQRSIMRGRFLFPYRTRQGELVQIKGRLDPGIPKELSEVKSLGLASLTELAPEHWMPIGANQVFFGEHLLAEIIAKKAVLLAEGEPDVCSSWGWDVPALGMSGGSLTQRQLRLLGEAGVAIYDARDNDEASRPRFLRDAYDGLLRDPERKWFRVLVPQKAVDPKAPMASTKVDVNDLARAGWSRAKFLKLIKEAKPALDLVVGGLAPRFRNTADFDKLAKLYRRVPVVTRPKLLRAICEASRVPPEVMAFGLDPSTWKAPKPQPKPKVEPEAKLPNLF